MIHHYYGIFMDSRTAGPDRLSWIVAKAEKWLDLDDST